MSANNEVTMNYWTLIDAYENTETYEHKLPHGTLVRVMTRSGSTLAESVVFVPNSQPTGPKQ